jgi:hypothetical protein
VRPSITRQSIDLGADILVRHAQPSESGFYLRLEKLLMRKCSNGGWRDEDLRNRKVLVGRFLSLRIV